MFKCENILTKEICASKIFIDNENDFEDVELEVELIEKVILDNKSNKNNYCIKLIDNFKFEKNQNEDFAIVTELLDLNLYEFIKSNQFKGFTMSL